MNNYLDGESFQEMKKSSGQLGHKSGKIRPKSGENRKSWKIRLSPNYMFWCCRVEDNE